MERCPTLYFIQNKKTNFITVIFLKSLPTQVPPQSEEIEGINNAFRFTAFPQNTERYEKNQASGESKTLLHYCFTFFLWLRIAFINF